MCGARAFRILGSITLSLLLAVPALADNVKIGVLAKDGPVKALKMWEATGDYLNARVSGTTFEIVPLGFDEVYPAIAEGTVQYFVVNSSMFVEAQGKYHAQAVATMINSRQGKPLQSFGGVIFTTPETGIESMADLKGHTFMAVDASSFGGWQMALKEMKDAGLDPEKDFTKLEFGKKHDNVVMAVLNGAVDAGTVRTDTLERMAADGMLDLSEIKVIHEQHHDGFPFVCSTALYPEWPIAATSKASPEVTQAMVDALQKMKPEDEAAKSAKVVGWAPVLDYAPVAKLQATLGL
ncbi:MAG: phosphate/phosphite/phosphonate ABC transporter substrate-binding protein [Candidatus Eisenbacteria bacterium]